MINIEGWESLAWELCADECGEDACTDLCWSGGPIPEPWGGRWMKYEDEAKRLIALVQKHTNFQQTEQHKSIPWVERWYGSGSNKGWWIYESRLTHSDPIAYIGQDQFAEDLATSIVQKHNESLFPAESFYEYNAVSDARLMEMPKDVT